MITFALPALVDRVRAHFVALVTPVPVTFGWREPTYQRQTSHRIIFVPGDDSGWGLGTLGAPESPGVGLARPIARLDEVFTCYIEAEDVSAPEDERKQYEAARILYDEWYRAVFAARVPHAVTSQKWVIDQTTRYAGAAIRVTGTVGAVVFDAPRRTAPNDTTASITVSELDVQTELSIPSEAP